MSTEAPAKAAPAAPATPAPAAATPPAAPAKPVTPPIPAAQAASVKPPTSAPGPKENLAPKPGETLESQLKRVSKEVFGGDSPDAKAAAAQAAKAPVEPAKPAAQPDAKPAEKKDAPAAPAAEVKDRFADVAPPDGATEVTQKGWKALKEKANAEIAAAEKKLADAQAQIETYRKATPAEAADLAKLQADLKAANDRLAVLDVSATPEFHNQYVAPREKALGEADQLLKDNAVPNAPEIASLLGLPRAEFAKKVSELATGMPAFDQGTFVANMREAYRLRGEEKTAIANAGELQKQIAAQNAQRQKAAFEETMKTFEANIKPLEVPDKASPEERAEIEQYNQQLTALRNAAEKNAFGRMDSRGVAELAAKAATMDFIVQQAMPRVQREYAKAAQLIKDLTAELDGLRAAKSPGAFSGDATPVARDPSKMTFADAMAEAKRMSAAR